MGVEQFDRRMTVKSNMTHILQILSIAEVLFHFLKNPNLVFYVDNLQTLNLIEQKITGPTLKNLPTFQQFCRYFVRHSSY